MKRLLIIVAVLLFAVAAFAETADRDVLITADGTVYSVTSEPSENGHDASLVLTVEADGQTTHSALPDSIANGINARPTLAYDATPRPLVDAFANGTPVIASRVGSLAELIEPGRNGLLFDAGSARDLARRLAWAEAFPEKMRQMGECARADYHARFIQSFSYRTLFGERRRTARL